MLSLLAELVRAYSGSAHYVAHYRFPQGTVTLSSDNDPSVIVVAEEVSALAYILDQLLVPASTEGAISRFSCIIANALKTNYASIEVIAH